MGDYFRGWKRKLGVVTLMAACLFALGWIRSARTGDEVTFVLFGRLHSFGSEYGELSWWARDFKSRGQPNDDGFGFSTWESCRTQLREVDEDLESDTPAIYGGDEKIKVISIIDLSFPARMPPLSYAFLTEAGLELPPYPEAVQESQIQSIATWAAPYWSLVLPLTLLSAHLLLSKPQPNVDRATKSVA